jgi:hypothetical protein
LDEHVNDKIDLREFLNHQYDDDAVKLEKNFFDKFLKKENKTSEN